MTKIGRRVVVTGASTGIGREAAKVLAREGASVALVARSGERLEATRAMLPDPGSALVIPVDLQDGAGTETAVRIVMTSWGGADVLINAAGVWHDDNGKYQGPLLNETPSERFNEVLDVGLRASAFLARGFLPGMIARRQGKIVNVACGFAGPHEARGWVHYYVTNKAIEAFTAALAAEMRPFEVQVNAIAPWFVASDAVRRFYPAESARALSPEYVASVISYLCSERADHISGETVELRSRLDRGDA
jgi:NAD(P)-dependent dehydrogenase (short-subunit alcohol dehydrogenase family)